MGGSTKIDDEMLRYIHFKFYQINNNYSRDPSDYKREEMVVEAKNCEASDFHLNNMERNRKIMKDWAGFSLICPKFEEGQGFTLEGNAASMVSNMIQFEILRCDNETQREKGKKDCHSPTDID